MGLRLKFNIVVFAVLLAGFGLTLWLCKRSIADNARQDVIRSARLVLEAASAASSYTIDHIQPHLVAHMSDVFLPQSVPAFAANEAVDRIRRRNAEFRYKEATLNPTNPGSRSTGWETEVVHRFRQQPQLTELVTEQVAQAGGVLVVARPLTVTSETCLRCHGVPGAAPASMRRIYGDSNGFGWRVGEIVGAQIVSVPLVVAARQADTTFLPLIPMLGTVFAMLLVALDLLHGRVVLRPLRQLAETSARISLGDFGQPEFSDPRADDIGVLGHAFNRMRRSLEKAMEMIVTESRS